MIIKTLLGGTGLVLTVGWFVWVLVPQESCERIERSGSVVRGVGNVLRDALEPRVSTGTRLDMIRWSLQAEKSFKGFVANQFFGRLDCTNWYGRDELKERLLEILQESVGMEGSAHARQPADIEKQPELEQ
jgi:hypothetical protein